MRRRVWMRSPHTGGCKISPLLQAETKRRIEEYANKHCAGRFSRLDIVFKGHFCYIDAFREPRVPKNFKPPTGETRAEYIERTRSFRLHLCRLRYCGDYLNKWSMAFYTYSNEKYEPSFFDSGEMYGTPEEGFATSAVYLQ